MTQKFYAGCFPENNVLEHLAVAPVEQESNPIAMLRHAIDKLLDERTGVGRVEPYAAKPRLRKSVVVLIVHGGSRWSQWNYRRTWVEVERAQRIEYFFRGVPFVGTVC